jgi:hypothetical protein
MGGKIGILTYFWSANHGTFLQAYSTLRAFQQRFPDCRVELVNLRHRRIFFRPNRRDVDPSIFLAHWRRHFIFKRCRQQNLVLSPSGIITTDYDEATAFLEAQHYDLIVVGADVVLEAFPQYFGKGQPSIYWLPPKLKCRKVVCAASCGTLTYESINERLRKKMEESIQAFDLVGVRSDLTYTLAENLGLKGDPRLQFVPDPAFTFDIDPAPGEALLKRLRIDTSRPTMAFSLGNRPDCNAIIDHYKAKGIQTVSFESPVPADHWLWAISPFEWAGIHRHFVFEVTDRFHGTLFCLRNGTPLLAIDRHGQFDESGQSKKLSLLRKFGLDKTCHFNIERQGGTDAAIQAIDAAMASPFDKERVQQQVEQFRQIYKAFLDRVAGLL